VTPNRFTSLRTRHWGANLARRCGIAVAATVVVVLLIAASAGVVNLSRDGAVFLGGWHPQALAFDVVEASLVVVGSVWILALAQRRLTSRAPVMAASARALAVAASFGLGWHLVKPTRPIESSTPRAGRLRGGVGASRQHLALTARRVLSGPLAGCCG
jgi:hypothetical protein